MAHEIIVQIYLHVVYGTVRNLSQSLAITIDMEQETKHETP